MDFNSLIGIYDQTTEVVNKLKTLEDKSLQQMAQDFTKIAERFEAKKKDPSVSIIVFGVYNSGKSTLINALLGKEVAATGDKPETKVVSSYRWGDFEVLDTPGLDSARSQDDVVSLDQLDKADIVIFVMNPIGVAEEAKTIEYMFNMLRQKKKVFVVLNPKAAFTDEDFAMIKDNFKQKLQSMADRYGLKGVLHEFPMIKVNAFSGYRAKIEGKKQLLKASNLPVLERQLNDFLQKNKTVDFDALALVLNNYLDHVIRRLNALSSDKVLNTYNELKSEILDGRERLMRTLDRSVQSKGDEVYTRIKSVLLNSRGSSNSDSLVQNCLQRAADDLQSTLREEVASCNRHLFMVAENYQNLINSHMDAHSLSLEQQACATSPAPVFEQKPLPAITPDTSTHSDILNPQTISLASQVLLSILPKTGGTILAPVIGSIPVIGTAAMVLTAIYSIFGGSNNDDELRAQAEEEQRQNERFVSQVEEFALETQSKFIDTYTNTIHEKVRPSFDALIEEVNQAISGLSEKQQTYQSILDQAMQLYSRTKSAVEVRK